MSAAEEEVSLFNEAWQLAERKHRVRVHDLRLDRRGTIVAMGEGSRTHTADVLVQWDRGQHVTTIRASQFVRERYTVR